MNTPAPVCVYKSGSIQEAHLVCDLLQTAGIEARIASDGVENVVGEVPFQIAGSPIWVPSDQEQKARAVLAEHRANRNLKPPLFCYHCGVDLEDRIATCPGCGGELDWSED